MRVPSTVWKALCAISILLLVFHVRATTGAEEHDNRLDQLFSSDPAVRGAAKAELLLHPDPVLLPALLKALPSSKGTNRDDIFEILAKYDDPRKIPVYLALLNSSSPDADTGAIEEQLARLGAPAAKALLANCVGMAAGILSWMHETGAQFLIEAVQSQDACKHSTGEQGLLYMFGDANADAVSRADIQLASDAAIDPDDRIRGAARRWFSSQKGREESVDFSGIIEALITAYQTSAPPETMVKIADMLSQRERPRVTRFMRAAVHAPNPEIQRIAEQYLSMYMPKAETQPARVSSNPQTPEQKIAFLGRLTNSVDGDVNLDIVPFLSDPNADVRAAAASALGSLNAPSNDVREDREIHPETASPGLRDALKDTSARVRAAAAEALGEMRSADDIEPLIAALKDSDASVVLSAAKALEQIPNDSAVSALTEIYHNQRMPSDVKNQAAWSLEAICNPDSIPIFLDDLVSGGKSLSIKAAWALQCALKKRPDKSAFEPIRGALEEAQPPWPVEVLVVPLAETKNPQAFDTLVPLLKSRLPNVARRAAEALGLLGDRRAIPVLSGLLKDLDYNMRSSAAFALTHFSDFSASPELIAALADADTTVQMYASKAIVLSHDPKGIDALIAAMPNPVAIYTLGESHDPRVVPALIAFLQNSNNNSQDRATAAESLGKLVDARAVDPLIASLSEDNAAITMTASYALAQLKDKRAVEPLKQSYARWSTGQRENADSVKGFIVTALLQLGVTDVIKK